MKCTLMKYGIQKQEQYLAKDGKGFDTFEEAVEYQQKLFYIGIRLNCEVQASSFGEYIVPPKDYATIMVFTPSGPVQLLRHQLYMEQVSNILETWDEVKILGFSSDNHPLGMWIVATRMEGTK